MPWEVKQGTVGPRCCYCCSLSPMNREIYISIPLLSLMTPYDSTQCVLCAPPTLWRRQSFTCFDARDWMGATQTGFSTFAPFRSLSLSVQQQLLRLHLKRTSWAIRLVFHFAPFSFRNPFFLFFLSTQASAKKINEFTIFFKWNWISHCVSKLRDTFDETKLIKRKHTPNKRNIPCFRYIQEVEERNSRVLDFKRDLTI